MLVLIFHNNNANNSYRKLTKVEMSWIDKMLERNFIGKNILREQVENSLVKMKDLDSCISLKFKITKNRIKKVPFRVRVPVEMTVFRDDFAPLSFLLHVIDGHVDELEIYTADGTKVNFDFDFEKSECIVKNNGDGSR